MAEAAASKKRSDINYALLDQMNWAGVKLAAAPRA